MKKNSKKSKRKKSSIEFDSILVVLGCAPNKDGHPSTILLSRIEQAVRTYRRGYFDKVILTGGPTKYPVAEAEIMAVFLHNIVPSKKLMIENKAVSTLHNALFIWELLKEKRVRKMTIITSDFHMARTRHVFEKIFEHMTVKFDFVSAKSKIGVWEKTKLILKEKAELARLKAKGLR